jgi:hypothetical protein
MEADLEAEEAAKKQKNGLSLLPLLLKLLPSKLL